MVLHVPPSHTISWTQCNSLFGIDTSELEELRTKAYGYIITAHQVAERSRQFHILENNNHDPRAQVGRWELLPTTSVFTRPRIPSRLAAVLKVAVLEQSAASRRREGDVWAPA